MFLDRMTFPQVDALDRDRTLLICAVGALEQHSHHMPLGTDHMIGSEVVRRLEERLSDRLLCLPTIWMGCSSHHLGFAGTISLSTSTLAKILADVAESAAVSGFKRVLFVNSHGGNRAVLAYAIQDLGPRSPDLDVMAVSYWDAAREALSELRETPFGGMGHACELETSLVLAFSSALVDRVQAEPDGIVSRSRFAAGEMLSPSTVMLYRPVSETSRHGGFGDPTSATPEKGERFFAAITDAMTDLCEDILEARL